MSGHDPAPSLVDVGVVENGDGGGDAASFASPSPFRSPSTPTAR
jgi:hypothetical protein